MKISVVIPTYEMFGKGVQFLTNSLEILEKQTFKDFEVVISDNSEDEAIKKIALMGWNFQVVYSKNRRVKNMSGNTNNGILKATGEYIKILFLDDYLAHENALQDIANYKFDWLVTACSNNSSPYYADEIKRGVNKIGSPSVLTFKNQNPLLLNEELNWVVDCDYYIRLYRKYGLPVISNKVNVVIGIGDHQVTNHLSDEAKLKEVEYLCQKYC